MASYTSSCLVVNLSSKCLAIIRDGSQENHVARHSWPSPKKMRVLWFGLSACGLCRRIFGKGALELRSKMDEIEEAPKQIFDLEGKCFLFKISSYSCVNDGATDWYIGSLYDKPATIVEYAQDDEYSSEESDDDENLDNGLNVDDANVLTPSSKRRREEDDDVVGLALDMQNSSNLKLKHVRIEKTGIVMFAWCSNIAS